MGESKQETRNASQRGRRQRKVGFVISGGTEKTVVVAVGRLVPHPRYGKRQRRTSTFLAHDERNECKVGDQVAIVETRPLSKRKRWRVSEIMRSGDGTVRSEHGPAQAGA